MTLVARSDQSTGNPVFASYVLQSNDLVFAFTAPYSTKAATEALAAAAAGSAPAVQVPAPGYDAGVAHAFLQAHGMAVRAVGE
jgi:4-hydroxyphenylpyruvate dioxygenase